MCIKIINWVKYYTKTIYLASQYMHLDAPRTACLCMDTCSSKQTQYHQSILQQQLLLQLVQCRCSIVIAQFILAENLQGIVSQTIRLDALLHLQYSLHGIDGLSSRSAGTWTTHGNLSVHSGRT